ncbi:hypothetical protein BP5796_02280 [Coleophoma crateriformis]|uniref:Major facilitator superfamily (MFS) profile domain-containing protein n=1 Tax=Coleophoma crateriformis TaxID=565419 RepID=A0A3D8SXS7_9HELO|nr:hypothetical protein BP5796_02280 [Coleophoma crateriformis]
MSNHHENDSQSLQNHEASTIQASVQSRLDEKVDPGQQFPNHRYLPSHASSQLDEPTDLEQQKTTHTTAPHLDLALTQSHIQEPESKVRETLFIAVLCMAQFTTQAGLGQAIAPLHIIGQSFGTTNPGQLSWFVAAYSLTVGTFILIAGRLGDVFGHKKFFIAGFLWYGIWSILAGLSVYSNAIFFDCCRAIQGIGPAFCLPNAIAILGRTYEPGRKQEMIFSIFGASAPSGFVFGAVFSSLFAQLAWWPWAYWVMGIFCIFLAVAGFIVIPHAPPPVFDNSVSMWKRVDISGSVVGVAGLVLVNFAWNQGPVIGWPTVYVYVLLIVGCIILGLFAIIESRAQFPLLPSDVFTAKTGFVLACIATGWASFGVWIFYLFQITEELRGFSPILASGGFAPAAVSGLCAALTTGVILSKIPPSIVMMAALLAFTIGGILVATAPLGETYWAQSLVAVLIMPWGMDMSFPAATIILSNSMHKEHQGLAASLVNTVLNYSISIGLGIAGTVESQVNNGGLTRSDTLKGYRGAQYVGIGLSVLGLIVSVAFGLHERQKRVLK